MMADQSRTTLNRAFGLTALAAGAATIYAWRRWAEGRPRSDEVNRITYPPIDTLKPVAENVWIVDSGPMKAAGLSIPVRMTVIRLANGDLLLHSPTRFDQSLGEQLRQLGPVRYLVAPSMAHWTFLPDWQRAFSDAQVWAVPGLKDRAQVRSADLRVDYELGDTAPAAWADDLEQGLVHGGAGFIEAYFHHRASGTLVLVDLIQNLDRHRLPPGTALLARLAHATQGKTAAHVRVATRLGGEPAKEGIRHLVQLRPQRVIFAHGSWFAARAAERLERAFAWIL